jgi:hypothetical protein
MLQMEGLMVGLAGAIVRAEEVQAIMAKVQKALTNTPTDMEEVALDVAEAAKNISGTAEYIEYRLGTVQ